MGVSKFRFRGGCKRHSLKKLGKRAYDLQNSESILMVLRKSEGKKKTVFQIFNGAMTVKVHCIA